MSRRARRRGPARCGECQAPIEWFRWAHNGSWFPFQPRPVGPGMHDRAYPVENGRHAWRFRDLVEDLMVRREIGQGAAEDEARDMPWHVPHTCTNETAEGDPDS